MSQNFFQVRKGLNLGNQASDPSSGSNGDFYYNTASNTFRGYANASWHDIVTADSTQTLTNKTLSGNTAANLISGTGTFVLNTSGTMTVPSGTDPTRRQSDHRYSH